MKQFLVYTAGPIKGFSYDGCTEWREYVKSKVHPSILTCSPMRATERLKKIYGDEPLGVVYPENFLTNDKAINTRDLFDVRRSDAIFVNFLGSTHVSIGTVMEVAWARALNVPVVCCMEEGNIHRHPMLDYACGYIVNSLDEGIEALHALLLPDRILAQTRIQRPEPSEMPY